MDSFGNFFRNWFGYSRRERRSTFILLNIIVIILGVRYIFPAQTIALREIPVKLHELNSDTMEIKENTLLLKKQVMTGKINLKRPLTELNSCDSAALEALPGIGPVLSSRIIKYRNLLGGFVNVGQLKEVYGLSEETFNIISSMIIADSLAVRKIRINEADYRELIRHPYFEKNEVASILKYRELAGDITDIGTMIDNNLISAETAGKIKGYLDFTR